MPLWLPDSTQSGVVFHVLQTQAPRFRLQHLIRLLEHLWAAGRTCDLRLPSPKAVKTLDRQLWQYRSTAFLPHAPGSEVPDAPIRLWAEETPSQGELLINLHPQLPDAFKGFKLTLELLDQSPELIERGRERYRSYKNVHAITPVVHKITEEMLTP